MSTNNISIPLEKTLNEDSMISTSTSISITEPITQDISKNKNVFLIQKNIEQRIVEILSFLQSDANLANTKIPILKYLQSLFMYVDFNSEIFLRKTINDKDKLNLYKVIIHQYIFYTNPNNSKADEENYRGDLQSLFLLLLNQVTFEKDTYHYILSPLINYIKEKNIISNKKNSSTGNILLENESNINIKSEHLNRILILLQYFYGYYKNVQPNYFFFSGDSDSSIIIRNKENPLDHNKKLLNLDDNLCIMMFIKVLPYEYIKAITIDHKKDFKLLELFFQDKKKSVDININIENQLIASFIEKPMQLKENDINCVIIKFNNTKKKSIINCQIFIGNEKSDLLQISLADSDKEKNPKIKDEIKEIILFSNFIGSCSNIIIYKEKKNEGLPKILMPYLENKQRQSLKGDGSDNMHWLFPNGIYNEELYSYFANAELIEQQDNIARKINILNSESKINYNIFRDFFNNNLISIYIPTRYVIPIQNEDKTIQNTSQIILIDSINGINAEFNTRTPALNGVHIFKNIYEDDLSIIGGINNLLPIMELMLDNPELLNTENFSSFFCLLTVYVLSPKYQKALSKDNSNFFRSLSYFLERIPEEYFTNELVEKFRTILGFLCPLNEKEKDNFKELKNQFYNYILTNEKILMKFNVENQKNLINQVSSIIEKSDLNADIIKIIRIMLIYDEDRSHKFCCKYHSEYFNDNYPIMEPELSDRLKPIEHLLQIFFDKTYKNTMYIYNEELSKVQPNKKNNKNIPRFNDENKFKENNLYYLFYLLTYDISPCMQKSIFNLLEYFLSPKQKEQNIYENFLSIFDRKKELLDIILLVFKNSFFDIKFQALHLLLLIDKQNKWKYLENKEIRTFIQNELLPVFLLEEVNDLNNINNNTQDKNEIKEEKINEEINSINIEEKKDKENKIKYGIKPEVEIDKVKYRLISTMDIEKKIFKKFNKKFYSNIVNKLYDKVLILHIYDCDFIFNLIIKTVSNGDLSLINNFLSKIRGMIISEAKKMPIYKIIINNNSFIQFILDTYLQLYILKQISKDKTKEFITSFYIEEDSKKKDNINSALNNCEEILYFILTENIINFDLVLTWGKYYEKIKEQNDIYKYIIEIIDDLLVKIFGGQSKTVVTFSQANDLNDPKILTSLYYLNMYFEFITFFKLEYSNSFFEMEKIEIYKKLEGDLKYILSKKDSENIKYLSPVQELSQSVDKIMNLMFTSLIPTFYPIWTIEDEKKRLKNENEVYTKYMKGYVNKNIYSNELDFLFHSFDEKFFKNKLNNICNKGMNMITIIYHFYICLLNIGGAEKELMDHFRNFRLYLLLLIISQSSINISEAIKKKKWKNEDQNKKISVNIYHILFNSVFFLYDKLHNLKNQENEYNDKSDTEKEADKKNIECISILKRIYMENLGFVLKILNKIYRGVKEDESQNKGTWNIFSNKIKIVERIKDTGAFFFINELYNECFISNLVKTNTEPNKKKKTETKNSEEKEELRKHLRSKTTKEEINEEDLKKLLEKNNNDNKSVKSEEEKDLNKTKTVVLDIQENKNIEMNTEKTYLDDITNEIVFIPENSKEINLSPDNLKKLETYINLFLEDKNIKTYYEKYYEQNKKDLYSFIPTIQIRQEKIKTMIPLFDNRKNISKYPYDLCLVPYYYPENVYKEVLMKKIVNISNNLKEEVKLSDKIIEKNESMNEEGYKKDKKKMFKFRGIWSYEDFFYDTKKYKLKYKLLNHYTNDFTKILMTPIADIDYYLPKFSKFKGEIFRNELSEASLIPITKFVDINFSKNKNNNYIHPQIQKNIIENESEINPVYELNEEYYNYLKEKEIKNEEKYENDFNPKDYEIFTKFIEKNHLKNKGQCIHCDACLVKLSSHIRGVIYTNNEEIGFYSYEIKRTIQDEDYDSDKKVCFGSIFRESNGKYNSYFIQIPINQIELIVKRRFYFKKNVLEIFIQNKKSYFFRIDEHKFDEFFTALTINTKKNKIMYDFDDISIETAKNEEKIGFVNKSNLLYDYNNFNSLFFTKRLSTTKNLFIKWTKWEISTFTLLNYINLFASRTYHDTNQYPVFPWIITNYKSKDIPNLSLDNIPDNLNRSDYTPEIRPLGTPMGMIGINDESKDRKENYLINFESPDEKNPDDNFDRYGSHYSTGLHLTYYLVRVFPFSYLRIEIQGKNFDDPNRLFNNLSNSFACAISQKSDLRELIPEFFCFPEMFYNINDLNLGEIFDDKIKKNILVNNITMPPWSNNDAYIFVKYHREMLESVEISEKIHEWFNIIFGSKQKGKAAKKIHNLFNAQTYDEFDEEHKKANETEKIYQNRMVEFGVTPSQVFKGDVDKRIPVKNLRKRPILYEFNTRKEKKEKTQNIFSDDVINEIKVRESELYIEGSPYKMFSSWKKDEEHKHEKMLFLYSDKVRIISKTEKGFFKKMKTIKSQSSKEVGKNKDNKEVTKPEENKEENEEDKDDNNIKEEKEKEKEKETKEENTIEENTTENTNDIKDNNNTNDISMEEEYNVKEEEIGDIALNKDISKYDRILICPKYRMDINQSPAIIYDKGNYIALGGFWNGQIVVNKLEESDKNKKNKSLRNINIIWTKAISPVTIMKIDESETFVLCANKFGMIIIYYINKSDKIEWNLFKTIQDNQKEITSLDLNENLNIFITSDREGFNNLYTFPECKLFNSFKLNENHFPSNNIPNNDNNSSSVSRSESNINLNLTQNDIFADLVIISHNPLPCIVFYIRTKKCLCVFSINFHFINAKYGIELVPNGIKKYSDYFRKDYLFIYNNTEKVIEIYDIISLEVISKSTPLNYTFVDFYFSKGMELALIMVRIDDNEKENNKDKNMKKNYKILMMNAPGKTDEK